MEHGRANWFFNMGRACVCCVVTADVEGPQVLVDVRFILMLLDFLQTSTQSLTSSPPPSPPPRKGSEPDSATGAPTFSLQDPRRTSSASSTSAPSPAPPPSSSGPDSSPGAEPAKLVVGAKVRQVVLGLLEDTTTSSKEGNPRVLVLQVRRGAWCGGVGPGSVCLVLCLSVCLFVCLF